jgi:hypothetical protein
MRAGTSGVPRIVRARAALFAVAVIALTGAFSSAAAASPRASTACTEFNTFHQASAAGRAEDARLLRVQTSGLSGASGRNKLTNAVSESLRIYSPLYNTALAETTRAHSDGTITAAWKNFATGLRLRIHGGSIILLALSGGGMTPSQKSDFEATSAAINRLNVQWTPIATRLNRTYSGC